MKKILCFVVTVFIVIGSCIIALAAENAVLYSEDISITQNEECLVPVMIKNNSGIMGMKVTVEYVPDEVNITSVKRGDILEGGDFNTNFGMSDTKFDVLWTNTSDVKENGIMFYLTVRLKQNIKDKSLIKLSYSQGDTFNEMWEDVKIDCKNITVKKVNESTTKAVKTGAENTVVNENSNTAFPDTSQIVDAVQDALKQSEYENVYEASRDKSFIDDVNKRISASVGEKHSWVSDSDSLKQMYEGAYETEFFNAVTQNDSKAVNEAVSRNFIQRIINFITYLFKMMKLFIPKI